MSKQKIADALKSARTCLSEAADELDRLESALVEREAGQVLMAAQIRDEVTALLTGAPDEVAH